MDVNGHLDELLWSRAELARRAGISVETANRIVAGLTVSRDTATKVLKALSEGYGRKVALKDVEGLKVSATVKRKKEIEPKKEAKKTTRTPRTKKTEQA